MGAFLTLVIGLLQQGLPAPLFVSEDGSAHDPAVDVLSSDAAGDLEVFFAFQSELIDPQSGLYVVPKLFVAYSVESSQGDHQGEEYVFGGPTVGLRPTITDFDEATGAGIARVGLPFNRVDSVERWGHFWPGENIVTAYWGGGGRCRSRRLCTTPTS